MALVVFGLDGHTAATIPHNDSTAVNLLAPARLRGKAERVVHILEFLIFEGQQTGNPSKARTAYEIVSKPLIILRTKMDFSNASAIDRTVFAFYCCGAFKRKTVRIKYVYVLGKNYVSATIA
jgi:hypothetical protein